MGSRRGGWLMLVCLILIFTGSRVLTRNLQILWWATRLTFNSYKIYRHMTRIFHTAGDPALARRTLRLYVQVVGKAHEAGGVGVGGADADTDRNWVETLVWGARMLCRLAAAGDSTGGADDAREAGALIEKAKTRLDPSDNQLASSIHLAEGVQNTTLALLAHDPRSRPTHLADALVHLAAAVQTAPTPAGYYHLALAFARAGPQQDLDAAITCASAAVEGRGRDVRFWHLLGLVLSAQGRWKEARGVLEVGAEVGEEVGGEEEIPSKSPPLFLLDKDSPSIPPSSTLLLPTPDYPTPSRQDTFEHAMQLRMTQLALAEFVEGAEGAGVRWVEVFGWVADRKGVVGEQREFFSERGEVGYIGLTDH